MTASPSSIAPMRERRRFLQADTATTSSPRGRNGALCRPRPRVSSPRRRSRGVRPPRVLESHMSAQEQIKRLTAPDIRARKGGEPIVCLTSYHAHTARLLDRHCDLILVGDLLGMVMHGLETTVPVTLDMMILQGLAVMRGSKRAMVVVDMPFGSYEASQGAGLHVGGAGMKETGCGAIKLEGGRRMAETIAFWSSAGCLSWAISGSPRNPSTPSARFARRDARRRDWGPIEDDARAVGDAGAFSVVIEAVAEPLARRITGSVADPHDRHRRQRCLRRPDPGAGGHARAFSRGCRNSCGAMESSLIRSKPQSPAMQPTFAPAPFRARNTSIR